MYFPLICRYYWSTQHLLPWHQCLISGFPSGTELVSTSFSSRMWQTELGWQEARDLCSSPRCINCDLKRFTISPNPYVHPGRLPQRWIRHSALNGQGRSNSADPKSRPPPPGSPYFGSGLTIQVYHSNVHRGGTESTQIHTWKQGQLAQASL